MALYTTDPYIEKRLLAERAESGVDRFDEMWDGVWFMQAPPDNEHQELTADLSFCLGQLLQAWPRKGKPFVYNRVNVSDRKADGASNYRVPDVAVFLAGNPAQDCDTHYCGGPDFLAEVVSPGDRSRDKMPFYARIGVREMLLVDRDPWKLELYHRRRGKLLLASQATLKRPLSLLSKVLPASFRLVRRKKRPGIAVIHQGSFQRWII